MSDRAAAIVKALLFESAGARHRRIAYGAFAFAIVLAWIVDARGPIVFAVDDAYITAHNADVLASGSDANYDVPGLTGATSLLHTALTALFALVAPGATAVYIVMWLGALAYVLGVLRLAFACRASIGQAVLLAVAAIAVAEVPHQLMNGLETGWALAAIVWTLALATEGLPRARITAALCGVLPLLRPELVVVSVLVLALQAWRRWTAGQPRAAALRAIAIDTAIAAAVVAPFVIALWATTGSPVPVTIAAKRAFYAEVCLPEPIRRARVINSVRDMVGLLGALSAAIILLVTTRLGRAGLAFIVVLLAAYYSQFPSALAHYQHRYMYPIVPFLVFGVASCLRDERRSLRWTAGAIVVATALLSGYMAPAAWRRHQSFYASRTDELAAVATFTRDHIPATAKILVHDAGYIAYATDHRLVDMVGLKTPSSAAAHARWTLPSCGRNRGQAVHEIALASQAEYMIVLNGWDRRYGFVDNLARRGWQCDIVRPVTSGRGYVIYQIKPPPAEPGSRTADFRFTR